MNPFIRKDDDDNRLDIKATLTIFVLVAIVVATGLLKYHQAGFGKGTVTIGDGPAIPVLVAASDATREKGLSGRKEMDADSGMLFLFATASKYKFWMKGMEIPLDAVWMRDGEIVDITIGIAPPVEGEEIPFFSPVTEADSVLEVPAGFAARHGLKLGLPVKFDIDRRGALR
ncbi:MAG: DUF192 domain-containing protein [Patescibacteria group bacterium]|nr:DUF192 domain-containing protein [Patescibacteria group bacterium]